MKSLIKHLAPGFILLFLVVSCMRDELDIDKAARTIEVQRDIAVPLIHGDIQFSDLLGDGADSIITIEGDTVFQDTVSLDLPDDLKNFTINFVNLPYHSKCFLPIGGNLALILYDSVSRQTLDTIKFAQSGLFLTPAPIDGNGNVIENQVDEKNDVIAVNRVAAENLFKYATHLILDARLLADSTMIIPVNESLRISLQIGIEAQGSFTKVVDF
jgi:hypothetical protein